MENPCNSYIDSETLTKRSTYKDGFFFIRDFEFF